MAYGKTKGEKAHGAAYEPITTWNNPKTGLEEGQFRRVRFPKDIKVLP